MTMQKVIASSALIAALTLQGCVLSSPHETPETNDCSIHDKEVCASADYGLCYWSSEGGVCANKVLTGFTCSTDAECFSGQCNFSAESDGQNGFNHTGVCAAAATDRCTSDSDCVRGRGLTCQPDPVFNRTTCQQIQTRIS